MLSVLVAVITLAAHPGDANTSGYARALPDTALFTVVDLRDTVAQASAPPGIVDRVRVLAPGIRMLDGADGDAYEADSGNVLMQLFVTTHRVDFHTGFRAQWKAQFGGVLRVVDARGAVPRASYITIADSASKSNLWGEKSARAALASVSDRVAAQIAAIVTDDVPRTSDPMTLHGTTPMYEPYLTAGTATVAGQAFLMTRGGDSKRAAGRDVTLDPLTPLAREWYRSVGSQFALLRIVPADALFQRARRTVVADADGRFTFTGIPAGTYLLRTVVSWEAPVGGADLAIQGGIVSQIVTVIDGGRADVVLRSTVTLK